ncbi:hypothetical protein [Afipia felis]|uniref:Uncharacterized protein n=1 Tax=Afipia felis TaxID=1035 RepID=A0A380W6A9_AFIFE|nr:hypothetical protein [Afipia felis]SUU76385.1 Uncharacterised protein [Afipia felis]SUU84452.1 Uncharacterised protein [Afipia felis]
MAKKAKIESAKIDTLEKIARLLAALTIKDMKDDKAALTLDGAGFDAREISQMLHVNENYIHALKSRLKSTKKKKAIRS